MNKIDLSKIPTPNVIEEISVSEMLDEMLQQIALDMPEIELHIADPAYKVLEVAAYHRYIDRKRANENAISLLITNAAEADLDSIGITYYGVERLAGEPDSDYKRRLLLSYDSYSTAGSQNSYIYHTLSASPTIKDATAVGRAAGEVLVTVLSKDGIGTASPQLISTVRAALSAEKVRPLNDQVIVQSASVVTYQIRAVLTLRPGPSPQVVREKAIAAAQALADRYHKLGESIDHGAIKAALYVEGVKSVELPQPVGNIIRNKSQAAYCTNIEVVTND